EGESLRRASYVSKWASCRFFFLQAEDGIRDRNVTGVQTCALPISSISPSSIRKPRIFTWKSLRPRYAIVPSPSHRPRSPVRYSRSEERRVGKEWRSRWAG